MTGPRRLALAAVGLVLVAACGGGSGSGRGANPTPSGPVVTTSASFGAAIAAYKKTQAAALASIATITKGASVLDAIDANASAGARDKTTSAVPGAVGPVMAATKALSGLTKQINAFAQAIQLLAGAESTPGISPPQVAALQALVAAANNEVAALRALQVSQTAGWPAYNQLQATETLWQMRAAAGEYPDETTGAFSSKVAGQAYQALAHPLRSLLATERGSLESGTAMLNTARAATSAAFDAAGTAFS